MTSRQASEAAGERRRGPACHCRPGKTPITPVADREFGRIVRSPTVDDDAGVPHAAEHGVVGEHAQRDHDVAEVRRHGVQRHPHPAGLQWRVGVGDRLQLQILERARTAHAQPPRPIARRHQDTVNGATAMHPRGVQDLFLPRSRTCGSPSSPKRRLPHHRLDHQGAHRNQRARSDRDARFAPTAPTPTPRRPPNR